MSITRVLKRGAGKNEYYINGTEARLKDIKEIAMETGMSKSSLAIISQGTVSDIAQASPEDRRGIFEEAAGISMYKSRRLEATRKLEKTSEDLEKIRSIVRELERQLIPLKKQAEKAKIYLEKYNKLKDIEIALIVENVSFYSKELKELTVELEDVLAMRNDLNERIEQSENELQIKNERKFALENELMELQTKYQSLSDKVHEIEVKANQSQERRKMIIDGQLGSSSKERENVMLQELEELRKKINQYNLWVEELEKNISNRREELSENQSNVANLRNENERIKTRELRLQTQISIFEDYKKNKTNLFLGSKTIIENTHLFKGLHGLVADLIKVDEKYTSAIEIVLKNALQHIVVDDSAVALKAINFLKNNNSGRATFIPLKSIKPKGIINEHKTVIENQLGVLGIASELISTKPKFSLLNSYLLGNIIVVDNIENANKLANLIQRRYTIVTLDGDLIKPSGTITGGSKTNSKELLGLDEKIKKIKTQIPDIQNEIAKNNSEITIKNETISEMLTLIAEQNLELARVKEKQRIAKEQFDSLNDQYELLTGKKAKLSNKSNEQFDSLQSAQAEKSSIQSLINAKRDSLISLNTDLSKITTSKTEYEKTLRKINEESSDKLARKSQAEFVVQQSNQRLSEEYDLTLTTAAKSYKLDMKREKATEIVSKLRGEIKELGHINLDSIEAFDEVNERFTKFKKSEDELFSAQQIILSAIDEMDQIITSRLDKTVKLVNVEMKKVFVTMFGGGHAEVKYTNPSDLLTTGIEVIAQPPGKTIKNLKLFSGGEKALVAISLLFAILKAKPLPLSILDEVEAALDDANVVRYANFLQKLKDKTQFIVVTHRVGTMARVDQLFGATMQQRGVTSFFSVELSKAKEMVQGQNNE